MNITEDLRKKFIRDVGAPIRVLEEPYFSHFSNLYEEEFQTKTKWEEFVKLLELFENEDEYFEAYHQMRDAAIEYLKIQPKLQHFTKKEDMNQYAVLNTNIPKSSVYKNDNVGRYFLSIDMKSANFTALHHYAPEIFDHAASYEEFISRFTEHEYLQKSKHIRQVIFGNVAPKRIGTYEKHLMDGVLSQFLEELPIAKEDVVFFGDDEIVIDISRFVIDNVVDSDIESIVSKVIENAKLEGIALSKEYFLLCRLEGTKGYLKEYIYPTAEKKKHEIKCVDHVAMPFVIRKLQGKELEENDFIFVDNEGHLGKLIHPYSVSIRKIPI